MFFFCVRVSEAAFFFSAISTQEKSKASVNEDDDESDDSDEATSIQIPTFSSEQLIDGNPAIVKKSLYPAITYWLALTTPSGAPASPIIVHRMLLTPGLSVTANTVSSRL